MLRVVFMVPKTWKCFFSILCSAVNNNSLPTGPDKHFLQAKSSLYFTSSYIVDCQGVVYLEGLVVGSPRSVQLRLRLISLFYSLRVPLC